MHYIINTTLENEHYCVARTNKTILLRVVDTIACNKNDCIGKCSYQKDNVVYVTWHKHTSTNMIDIKNALLQQTG